MAESPGTPDAIEHILLKNELDSIMDDMSLTLVRTAHSTIMRESMDFSTAFCDRDGQILVQGVTLPLHLGSIEDAMRAVVQARGASARPGDVFILNDPFDGGSHLQDIFTVSPMFAGDELVGYVGTVAHHADVGGRVPGSNAADSTEIYQEGLRIPISQLYRAGKPDENLFGILAANVRLPSTFLGDLRAQLAAAHVGAERFGELATKVGWPTLRLRLARLLDYSERMTRTELAKLRAGEYRFTDYMDDDGFDEGPIPIQVCVTIGGGEIVADFTGSSPQVRGAINCTNSFTKSSVYLVVASLIDRDIPKNAGFFRPIKVVAPPGSVLNLTLPAPCAARAIAGYRAVDALYGALAQALPDRVFAAGDGGNTFLTIAGANDDGEPCVLVDSVVGAWGARPTKDGLEGNSLISVNLRNQSIEAIEAVHPVRIEQYGFVRDTGGAGKFRGGLGLVRDYRLRGASALLQVRSDRKRVLPYGLAGGEQGTPSLNLLNPGRPDTTELPSKFTRALRRGDLYRHILPGGGGFGNPLERDPERVATDVRLGYVSPERARDAYGVIIDPGTGELDRLSTTRLREHLRSSRRSGGQ